VLAKQGETAGLTKSPLNQAALQLGRDRVLSDLQLSHLDGLNKPSQEALEKRARDVYEAEAKRFEIPEEVLASHILVLATEDAAEEKANAILADLKSGQDFAELAKTKSQDPGSAAKGGSLGYFAQDRMVKEFSDVAFALEPGQLSGIVKTQFGYHIIKVLERKKASKRPFDEVKEELFKDLNQKILTEGRLRAGDQILSKAKAHPAAIEAFMSSQKKP
jgi:peptidyl-prolyl cis-trans isomerase C